MDREEAFEFLDRTARGIALSAITSATLIDSYHQVMLGTLSRLPS